MPISVIKIIKTTSLVTIQSKQRTGFRKFGVPSSGFQDEHGAYLGNWLVGNDREAPSIEVFGNMLVFEALSECVIAIGGACSRLLINDQQGLLNQAHKLVLNDVVVVENVTAGSIFYLSIAGIFFGESVMGSVATDLTNGWGGFQGRILKKGDLILGTPKLRVTNRNFTIASTHSQFTKNITIHIIAGPEAHLFSKQVLDEFYGESFALSADSNRVGYRLSGTKIKSLAGDISSKTVLRGTIQVPPSGDPIILMADGPTTGGYPRIGVVADADIGLLAQVRIGGRVRFRLCTPDQARRNSFNQRIRLNLFEE